MTAPYRWYPTPLTPRGWFVYVGWAAEDAERPLYVGSTSTIHLRLGTHLTNARWARELSYFECIQVADRTTALRLEAEMIRRLDPIHNVVRPVERLAVTERVTFLPAAGV